MTSIPQLAVVLGAGFSQGFGLPGTTELTTAIDHAYDRAKDVGPADHPDIVRYERLIHELREEYVDAYSFEVLVEALQSIRQFGDGGWPLPRPRSPLRPLAQLKTWLDPEPIALLDRFLEQSFLVLREQLLARQKVALAGNLAPEVAFFQKLRERFRLECINLNFDNILDCIAEFFFDGFILRDDDLGAAHFDPLAFDRHDGHRTGHVHGSLRFGFVDNEEGLWQFDDAGANARRWVPTEDGASYSAIVTGLLKTEKVIRPPYNHLYRWASNVLANANRLLLIGYGVGDLHLNVWLAHATVRPGVRICVISNDEDLDRRPDLFKAMLSMAAGCRYLAEARPFAEILNFDSDGFARRNDLAVLQRGVPRQPGALNKLIDFLA
jgi:hypothetical protein